jgi:uncharacterized protein (TIGR02246 family)
MDRDAIAKLLTEFGNAWNEHDLDAALALTTPDVVFESTGPSPDGIRSEGRDAVREAWAPIFADPSSHFDGEELIIDGDTVVQCWTYRFADGHVRGIDVFVLRDGLVAAKHSYVKG